MPKLTNSKLPKYCRVPEKNIGYFWKDGKKIYLPGKYGSPESKAAYDRAMASLLEERVDEKDEIKPSLPKITSTKDITVRELFVRFLKHAETYYMKNGKPTGEAEQFAYSLKIPKELFGDLKAAKFGKAELKFVQKEMIESGNLCRNTINKRIRKIKHVFKWAVEEDLIDEETALRISSVKPLKKGRTAAKDHPRRKAVKDTVIEATLPLLPRLVADMVQIQRLTGMRPDNIFSMTWDQIDTIDDDPDPVWIYAPSHKTEDHDIFLPVPLTSKCQSILERYRDTPKDKIIFSPKRTVRELAAEKAAKRKSKRQPSQVKRYNNKQTRREHLVGDTYNAGSYRKCIQCAIKRYNKAENEAAKKENREPVLLPMWCPYQIRHTKASEVYRILGKEAVQALYAHTSVATSEIYIHETIEHIKEIARALDKKTG